MGAKTPLDKLRHNIRTLSENYLLDLTTLPISDGEQTVIDAWNLTAMMLAYASKSNALLIGEPGWGKTTSSALVGCASTGLPLDLYRSTLVKGHPNQFEEKMTARPDFGKMHEGKESVVWQKAVYFPVVTLDEFNRLKEGIQSQLLDEIETGRFSYMNDHFYLGPKSFFATANHSDGGNFDITPPNLDRFHLSLEFGYPGALYNNFIHTFRDNQRILEDGEKTSAILKIIQENGKPVEGKMDDIAQAKQDPSSFTKKTGLEVLSEEEYEDLDSEIQKMEVDHDADLFWMCITSELNTTGKYGIKRRADPLDEDTHGKELASYKTNNGLSPRGFNESLLHFAKAIALYTGAKKVSKAHIQAIAPYALGHRLEFTQDFESSETLPSRNCTKEHHLARVLVNGISEKFETRKNDLYALHQYATAMSEGKPHQLSKGHEERVEGMVQNPNKVDYPLMREYALAIARVSRNR